MVVKRAFLTLENLEDLATVEFTVGDPHFQIVTSSPVLSSFAPGAMEFVVSGLTSAAGFAGPETEFLCPVPGVPEPGIWMLLLAGFGGLFAAFRKRPQKRYEIVQDGIVIRSYDKHQLNRARSALIYSAAASPGPTILRDVWEDRILSTATFTPRKDKT